MSPAIQGDYISDLDPLQSSAQLAGALFEVEPAGGPAPSGYVSRRATAEQLVAYLVTQGLGGPLSGFQTVRFRTRAEASAPGAYGGQVLEELDRSTLFTYARVFVEFWRDDPTNLNERPRSQMLIAVYDQNADADHMGYATSGGPAAGVSRVGLKLVLLSDPAATGVLQYDAGQAVMQGQLRYYDDGQGAKFYEALKSMISPVPAPMRGIVTSYWKPVADPPVPGGPAAVSLYYTIADAIIASNNSDLPAGRPTAAIADVWNGQGDSIVYLQVLEADRWAKYGQLLDAQGDFSFVEVDLDNATARPYVGEFLPGLYVVQPADVTSPASDLVIATPGAVAITAASILRQGVSGGDPIYPILPGSATGDYTIQAQQFTILAKLNPPLQAGDEVHWSYLAGAVGGAGYTDVQARAAQLNRVAPAGTTTVLLTAEAPVDYGTAASGTFTIDATGCVVGKETLFCIGAGGTAPVFTNSPANQPYKFLGAVYGPGLAFSYSLLVRQDRIEVIILAD